MGMRLVSLRPALVLLVIASSAAPAAAGMLKYVNEKGEVAFVDSIDKIPPQFRDQFEKTSSAGATVTVVPDVPALVSPRSHEGAVLAHPTGEPARKPRGLAPQGQARLDWNETAIQWQTLGRGLSVARSSGRPICMVLFARWCPHSVAYSAVFHDPEVVQKAKVFVMILVDTDKDPHADKDYAPDGKYVPRTLFLNSSDVIDPSIHANRTSSIYFFNESDPMDLLAAMDKAAKKLR